MWRNIRAIAAAILGIASSVYGFDGSKWNISTGNLSTYFIQASPIGAHPKPGYQEPPPAYDEMKRRKSQGLAAYEDYIAWGAVETTASKWDWKQHDDICAAVHKAGLKYVAYNWVHFPPLWLRQGGNCTLMKSLNTGLECNYLSIFDPRSIRYYDHFYHELAAHFGNRLDGVYACILGPYGEGNYPLYNADWVNVGPAHEGYWCGDKFALKAFRAAMRAKYESIDALNAAWGTRHAGFDELAPPIKTGEPFKASPTALDTGRDRRCWLDFITWYHQAIIDFAEQSLRATLRYFPADKVRMKPGGNAGGINPIAWGTYCPGYARMAGKYGVVLQPADCQGAYFGDKWVATSYQFYQIPLSTEPAASLDSHAFVRRMFSDISCGARQFFTYEFDQHTTDIQKYISLYNGRPGETEIAVLCPTSAWRLGHDLTPTIRAADQLRDLAEYDVLDELLINDGALTRKYSALLVLQPDYSEKPVLDKMEQWVRRGGSLIVAGDKPLLQVDGKPRLPSPGKLERGEVLRIADVTTGMQWLQELTAYLKTRKGVDGQLDGFFTCRRGTQTITYDSRHHEIRIDNP